MGIGNDIKPKRSFQRPHHHINNDHNIVVKKETVEKHKPQKEHSADNFDVSKNISVAETEKLEELKDDFFDNQPFYANSHQDDHNSDNVKGRFFKSLSKVFVWVILAAILVLLVYQNFDSIKSRIFKIAPEKVDSVSTDDSQANDDFYNTDPASEQESDSIPLDQASPATTATPTPTPAQQEQQPSAQKPAAIAVYNGNGISGSADKVADALKASDYNIVKVANAKNFNYSNTIIYHKTGRENEAAQIKQTLTTRNCTIELSDSITGTYDIIIVVGKK